ncbi:MULTISPECIES: hypothetical protein [unclassified Nocardioides]|uniref:hypothetical protein n=1 Tax=unclassified Nocardioides TaxID=2615069 RepID=UPI000056F745|nr:MULTISPECIES: hypothetical protein [unclassified Nocardioides]ABL83783.1 hypothetical protein Noca_4286 [Nocardioides sp. JS614]
MGSATPEETQASSFDLLNRWLAHHEREPGLAVLEDLARAALLDRTDSSRQPDPAATPPPPEGGGASDARGSTGAATPAALVTPGTEGHLVELPLDSPGDPAPGDPAAGEPAAGEVPSIDLSVEPTARRVAGFLLFAAAVLTAIEAAVAYADPGAVTLGFAAVLLLATGVAWRAWARHPSATVLVTGSRLEVLRDGGRHVFDLADLRSPVDVIGLPGDRGWRVLFYRRGMAPYVLDAGMVDAAEFMRVLHARRSEVHYLPR